MKTSKHMLLAFLLNFGFAIIEWLYGRLFHSSMILADAVHDLGDALAIGFSTLLEILSYRKKSPQFSFGYQRLSLLGALFTSLILVFGSFGVMVNNIMHLATPPVVNYDGMLWLGIAAISVNGLAKVIVSHVETRNESILSLHFLEDILGWVAVIGLSVVIKYTHWYILDPLASIAIAIFILTKALPKLFETIRLFLEAVPAACDYQQLHEQIESLPVVAHLSQLNIWSLDGNHNIATVHVCLAEGVKPQIGKRAIYIILQKANITSATIEIDKDLAEHEAHCVVAKLQVSHQH